MDGTLDANPHISEGVFEPESHFKIPRFAEQTLADLPYVL